MIWNEPTEDQIDRKTRRQFLRNAAFGSAAIVLGVGFGKAAPQALAQTAPAAYPPGALEDPSPGNGDFGYELPMNPYHLGSETRIAFMLDRAKAAGATGVAVGVAWDYAQPKADAAPSLGPIDSTVRLARERGLTVAVTVTGTPDWVHPWLVPLVSDPEKRKWHPPMGERELGLWSGFIGSLASRYAGWISRLTIWNEPNVPFHWQGTPGDHTYVELLRVAYYAVKNNAPGMRVAFGGLSRNDVAYLQRFYDAAKRYADAASNRFYFDVLDVHPYIRGGFSPEIRVPPDDAYSTGPRGLPATKAVMDRNGDLDKPIFCGEFGYTTAGNSWFTGSADHRRAIFLKQGYFRARQLPYVEGMNWFALHPAPGADAAWTMLDGNDAPNRTYRALAEATGVARSLKVWPKRPSTGIIRAVHAFYPGFSSPVAATSIQSYELYVNGRYAGRSTASPVRYDTTRRRNGPVEVVLVAHTKGGSSYASQPVAMTIRN